MLKPLIGFCLLAGVLISAAAQQQNSPQDTMQVNRSLQLSEQYFLKDSRSRSDLDSSLLHVLAAEHLSERLAYQRGLGNSYEQLSKILHVKGDSTKGREFANKAISIFKVNNYWMELGYAWYDLSGYYSFAGNGLVERIRLLGLALSAFQRGHSTLKQADIHKELGDLYQIEGNYSTSLQELKQALALYQATDYPKLLGVYDLLGFVSTASGDQKEGIRYGLLAVQTAEMLGDSASMMNCTIYNRLGITYFDLNEFDKAEPWFQKALSIAIKYRDDNAIQELAQNITRLLLRRNKPKEALLFLRDIEKKFPADDHISHIRIATGLITIYTALHQYEKAQQACDQLLALSEKQEMNDEEKSLVYTAVIPWFLTTRNYSDARKYLLANTIVSEKTGSLMNLSVNHLWWFKLDSAQGNYLSAISHYQEYKKLNDSLFNESKSRQIHQLEIVYNIEKKDKDLELKGQNIQLLTKKAQLQQSQLQQATLTRNVTLGGTFLLLVIIALLYKNVQYRQKRHKLSQQQQAEIQRHNDALQNLVKEKDWLVKEIHHRVKNNFHMVMGLLGTQSGYLKSEEALDAIGDSQHRIHAMSLIHQKLYQSDNLSAIDMRDYIHELVDYLRDCFNICNTIQFKLDIDRIELDLSHCVPLGLILNEAITNAIKYAFPGNKEGIISISFTQSPEKKCLLRIADDGAGLPPGFDKDARDSMGMNLMQGLCEDLDGKFSITGRKGTEIKILFINDPEPADPDPALSINKQAYSI